MLVILSGAEQEEKKENKKAIFSLYNKRRKHGFKNLILSVCFRKERK